MPKIAFEANELTQVQVSHISLVKRGANKVPFRLLKSDGGNTEMIQFKIGSVFSKTDKTPKVAAILVSKDADLDAAKARITKAGFSVENMTDSDNAIVFAQNDYTTMPEDPILLKMDGEIAMVLANVSKAFESMNLESTSFGEVFAQEGLVPGFRLAMEAMNDTFHNVLAKAENPEDMTRDIGKIMDEFAAHIQGLAKAVPPDAFSLDFFKADTEVKKVAETDGEKVVRLAKEATAKDEADAATKATADADAAAKAKLVEDAGDDPAKLQAIASLEAAEVATENQAILMKAIHDQGEKTTQALGAFGERIAVVEATSKDTKNAISKTAAGVVHKADDDPAGTGGGAGGADENTDPPLIDTAYSREFQKKATPDADTRH